MGLAYPSKVITESKQLTPLLENYMHVSWHLVKCLQRYLVSLLRFKTGLKPPWSIYPHFDSTVPNNGIQSDSEHISVAIEPIDRGQKSFPIGTIESFVSF